MTLIYTTFKPKTSNYEYLIWEWLISLRTLGNYQGEIVIFDYGMGEDLINRLNNFKLGAPKIIKLPSREMQTISNYRNIDVIPYLEQYKGYSFAHFDADIWFQNDINILFEELKEIEGCYFGNEVYRTCRYRGPKNEEDYNLQKQIQLKGFIFGGWIGGRYEPYLNKLKYMKSLFESGWDTNEWGTDQSMVTHIFDFLKDNQNGAKYGLSPYYCNLTHNKILITSGYPHVKFEDEGKEAIGIHLTAYNKNLDLNEVDPLYNLRFQTRHPELWKEHSL
jgi:hypothetical protein